MDALQARVALYRARGWAMIRLLVAREHASFNWHGLLMSVFDTKANPEELLCYSPGELNRPERLFVSAYRRVRAICVRRGQRHSAAWVVVGRTKDFGEIVFLEVRGAQLRPYLELSEKSFLAEVLAEIPLRPVGVPIRLAA